MTDFHGLIGGDEGIERALVQLHLEVERARREGKRIEPVVTNWEDARALACTILNNPHSQEELATLAMKLASRVHVLTQKEGVP